MLRIIKSGLIVFLLFFICSINVFAYTVDDVRDLVGEERVDDTFTQGEIDLIIKQYEKIEKANMYIKLFDIGKEIDINSDLEKMYQELEADLAEAHEKLEISFQSGKSIDIVLKDKSNLESILHKIASLRDRGYDIEVEYIPNIWEEKYLKVQNVVKDLNEQFDIGDVGENLKIPLDNTFVLLSPYGLRLNPFTFDSVSMHNGIDFSTVSGTRVLSLWNGVVSKVYETESGGKTVEITHGQNLKTIYMHLNEIKVEIGKRVKQYDLIGLSGNTGKTTEPHLHLGVYLDDKYINPIYLFGTKGLQAFKTYVSNNPEDYLKVLEIENQIKDKPSKEIVEKEKEIKPSTDLIVDVQVDSVFNKQEFYEHQYDKYLEEQNQNEDDESKEEKEQRKQEVLQELLNS